jgi:hypothetical protein
MAKEITPQKIPLTKFNYTAKPTVPWLVSNYNKSITVPETSFLVPCYADHITMHCRMFRLGMLW